MPLTRLVADAFGVLTICLVSLFILLGLLCILYSVYFRSCIQRQGVSQLGYFNGPWIIRIVFILLAIWWGFGEVLRLSLLRRERVLDSLSLKWQENICKFYILSNLGFAEPALLLILVLLLRASLQNRESGTLSRKWNGKTAGFVFLYCIPLFVFQLIVILMPKFNNGTSYKQKMPHYFTNAATSWIKAHDEICLCTYPLLSTILLGLFVSFVTAYFLWLGRQMVFSVINQGLRQRVYLLFLSISSLLPLRVLLLGLSVLSRPEHILFEALVFLAFLVLLYCAGVGIFMLVYRPIADSLPLRELHDMEDRERLFEGFNDSTSLVANPNFHEASTTTASLGRNSDASTKRGSISFRTMVRDEASTEAFEEISLFSPGTQYIASSPSSPQLPGLPMLPLEQVSDFLERKREREKEKAACEISFVVKEGYV